MPGSVGGPQKEEFVVDSQTLSPPQGGRRGSCVPVRPGEGFLRLRRGFVGICRSDSCAALLLDLFFYWTDSPYYEGAEFQKTINEFRQDLLAKYSEHKVRAGLESLTDLGLIEWTKAGDQRSASSFRLNPEAVNEALDQWEPEKQFSNMSTKSSERRTESDVAYKEPRARSEVHKIQKQQKQEAALPAAAGFSECLRTHFSSLTEGVEARCRSSAEARGYSPETVAEGIKIHGAPVMAGLMDRERTSGRSPNPIVFTEKVLDRIDKSTAEANAPAPEQPAYMRDPEPLDTSSEPVDPDGWRDKEWLDMRPSLGPEAVDDPEAAYRKFHGLPAAALELVKAAA